MNTSSIYEIVQIIDNCLKDLDYINALCWTYGLSSEEVPKQVRLFELLLRQRQGYYELIREARRRKQKVLLTNADEILAAYREAREILKANKERWKNGPIKVVCSEREVMNVGSKIKNKGSISFTKDELEKRFDFSQVLESWEKIPDYTLFFLGGGVRISSPECDLFETVCWSYNEAVRCHQAVEAARSQIGADNFDWKSHMDLVSRLHMMCRQVVINAFLLVEAFLNGLAAVYLSDHKQNISVADKLYLSEQAEDATGRRRQKYVSIQDKLYEWVRLMSPRKETFDKGKTPYQTFMQVKEYRDSLVHLSSQKITRFRSINIDLVKKAAHTAIEIIERISEFLAPNKNKVAYPFWLTRPGADGLFTISREIEAKLKTAYPTGQVPVIPLRPD